MPLVVHQFYNASNKEKFKIFVFFRRFLVIVCRGLMIFKSQVESVVKKHLEDKKVSPHEFLRNEIPKDLSNAQGLSFLTRREMTTEELSEKLPKNRCARNSNFLVAEFLFFRK